MTVVGMFDEIKKNDLIKKLKKQLREAEGELSIIKGINFNSDKQKEINILEAQVKEAREINKLHQELNGKLQTRLTEVEEDNKTLSKQIQDLNKRLS